MKAIALQPGTTNIRLADWIEPQIQKETEIKAKVLLVGICGTDKEEAAGGRADAPQGEKELVIGHEMLGEVVAIGTKVTKVKLGDRVVFTVRRGCNACDACLAFRSDYCETGRYQERGIKGLHGFQAAFVVDEEMYAVKVPSSLGAEAVLAEPMAVVQKAIEEALLVQAAKFSWLKTPQTWLQGKTVCVAGLGPIGMLASVALRLKGANVIGLDRAPADGLRARLLQAMGGVYVNDKTWDLKAFKNRYPHIQLILDAAGMAKLDFDLLQVLGINGVLVLTGVPGNQSSFPIDEPQLMRQLVLGNQTIIGSVNESINHFAHGLKDLEAAKQKWPGIIEQFLTHRFAYTDFEQGFAKHGSDAIKAAIDWER